jgi:Ca2+-binding RTX toxin-like protein
VEATDARETFDLSAQENSETGAREVLISVTGEGTEPPTLRLHNPRCEITEPGNVVCGHHSIVFRLRGGDDRLHVSSPSWEPRPGEKEMEHITGEVYGGSGADRITVGPSLGWIRGGAGDDTLSGSLPHGEFFGERGNDVITSADAEGGPGDDEIRGTGSGDRLFGGSGRDVIHALAGSDVIGGGLGNDRLFLQPGQDTVYASRGDDRIFSDDGRRDVVNCGAGHDTVDADGADQLRLCDTVT